MSELKTFVLWNEEKATCDFQTECDTFERLKAAEEKHNSSLSSTVNLTENQLKQVLEAVYNETDIQLKWHELKNN